jgi:hypothetical protein
MADKIYTNEEKDNEEIVTDISADVVKNFDEASRRINLSQTGTFKTGQSENSGGLTTASVPTDIVLWAGAAEADKAIAPFRVDAQGNLVANSATIAGVVLRTQGFFGGDGSDGALTKSSGTETIDLAGVQFFVKNYSSISITGTGKLAFSNPHANGTIIILKSQGNVILTSSTNPNIDCSGLGSNGGASGSNGTNATGILDTSIHYGTKANAGETTGGVAGVAYTTLEFYTTNEYKLARRCIYLCPGSGGAGGIDDAGAFIAGGGGGAGGIGAGGAGGSEGNGVAGSTSGGGGGASALNNGNGAGGAGGKGGGAILIECGGDLNMTGNIWAKGNDGADINQEGASAGGGGAGGMVVVLYNTQTAVSGTIDTSGGTGGDNAAGPYTGGAGGASNSGLIAQNYYFG